MVNAIADSNASILCKHLFCPVSGLPVYSREEWSQRKLGADYKANLCIMGQAILHGAPTGSIGLVAMQAGLKLLHEVAEHIKTTSGRFVFIEDLSGLGNVTSKARKAFIGDIVQNPQVAALIFYNVSPFMKFSIKIGRRLNTRGIEIHIFENYTEAIEKAMEICSTDGLETGPRQFDPIPAFQKDHPSLTPVEMYTRDEWIVQVDGYYNRSILIDHTIMYSQSRNYIEPSAIKLLDQLRHGVREATPDGSNLDYIIVDVRRLEGGSRMARKYYMQSLKDWCARYPLRMYILIGANAFMRSALLLARPFMPFTVAVANDVDHAFAMVRNHRQKVAANAGRIDIHAASRAARDYDIDEVLAYIGTIDWEEKGIDMEVPLDEDHSLHPVVQAIQLIKGELDDLLHQRELAEKALRQTDLKYRELFESGSDWLCIHDLEGYLLETNFKYKKELDWDALVTSNPRLHDLVSDRYRSGVDDYLQRIRREGHEKGVFSIKAGGGREIILEYNNVLIRDDNGEPTWVKSSARDITSEIKAAREKSRIEKKLQQSMKMESIGTLAGGIAHDFNNILSSVIGFTELALEDAPEDSLQQDNLQEVLEAGNRAKELVRQILTFARQSDEKRKPIQAGLIAKEVLKLLRSSLPATIDIKQRIMSHAMILGNPTQVHQILMNLCTNAAHAMEEKGGFLEIRAEDVTIEEAAQGKFQDLSPGPYLKLTVSDTGPGIPEEIIDNIFEPYFSTKPQDQGTGMGLAIVHGIVKGYDGEVYVESRPGSGAVFTVLIPIAHDLENSKAYQRASYPTGTENILLIDDEYPILKAGFRMLDSLGYTVTTRANSSEALALFESRPDRFDLVITDMTMPELTGDQLAQKMLKIRPDLPIIICTGFNKKISESSAREIGIQSVIYKPVDKAGLSKTIREVLDRHGMPRAG